MRRVPYLSFSLLLAIAACGGSDPVDDKAKNTAALPDINAVAPTSTGEPHVDTQPAKPLPSPVSGIPVALQGRWALTAADCTSTRGDNKGLLVVTSDELRFYESRAVPAADVTSDTDSISGSFAFTGEGQSWTKYEALKVDKKGLTRTETNPTASFSYAKCS
jgi:hypothetical protein